MLTFLICAGCVIISSALRDSKVQAIEFIKPHGRVIHEVYMTALEKDRYTYRIIWSPEDSEYVGLCAEFPSLSWLAESPDEALKGIRKVVTETVDDMRASGEEVPESLSCRIYSGKLSVRIPPEMHKELTLKAAEEGISLNRLINAQLSKTLTT